jgi:hypothetical protein
LGCATAHPEQSQKPKLPFNAKLRRKLSTGVVAGNNSLTLIRQSDYYSVVYKKIFMESMNLLENAKHGDLAKV